MTPDHIKNITVIFHDWIIETPGKDLGSIAREIVPGSDFETGDKSVVFPCAFSTEISFKSFLSRVINYEGVRDVILHNDDGTSFVYHSDRWS